MYIALYKFVDGCDGWDCRGETYFAHKMDIPHHYPNVVLHEYVIMPNHVHCIVQIVDDGGCGEYNGVCKGEKFFAPTCAPPIAPNNCTRALPNIS